MRTSLRTAGIATLTSLLTVACSLTPGPRGRATEPPRPFHRAGEVRLVSYSDCDELVTQLRQAAAARVTPWGFDFGDLQPTPISVAEQDTATARQPYSLTNVREPGVDEPDLVKTDGNRLITVSRGVLQVVDVATKRVTGTLRLAPQEHRPVSATLLVFGDRALVVLRETAIPLFRSRSDQQPDEQPTGPRYVLVDLSAKPRVLGSLTVQGSHLDARQVGSLVRIVVSSRPRIGFPQQQPNLSESEMIKRNRAAVLAASVRAWLPQHWIEERGARRTGQVRCDQVSHPTEFTGTSLLTVHTIDLAGTMGPGNRAFDRIDPVSVVADGDTVYSTPSSLYVTSNPRFSVRQPTASTAPIRTRTEVHRFDTSGLDAPQYVVSGSVPGRLLNQYAVSEHAGHLRLATTTSPDAVPRSTEGPSASQSGVYVLDAVTLAQRGSLTGLGRGERIYAVRFLGSIGYVVTFRITDPLYALDLRDPSAPRLAGELKVSGYSTYLHPVGPGRLLGVGQEADERGTIQGAHVSLFDVADPARPQLLTRYHQVGSGSEAEWEPHAFTYWGPSALAMIPWHDRQGGTRGSTALILKVGDDAIRKLGLIEHPAPEAGSTPGIITPMEPGIRRCVVIGDAIWTVSGLGIKVSDLSTLADRAWIPFT